MRCVRYRIGILVAGFMIVANGCARGDNADSGTLSGVTTTKAPNGSAGNNLGLAVNAEGSPGTHHEYCPVKTITIGGSGFAFNEGPGRHMLSCTCTVDGEANGEKNKCGDGSKAVTDCMYQYSFPLPPQRPRAIDYDYLGVLHQKSFDLACKKICMKQRVPKFIQECANILLDPPPEQKDIRHDRPVDPVD